MGLTAVLLKKLITRIGRKRLPVHHGELQARGLKSEVEIIRDSWGVPHIYANNVEDLFFAQGFVHAQDRLWQMELNRRTGKGTLSELFGDIALDTDRAARTFGWNRLAQDDLALCDDTTREALASYVRGINAFLEAPSSHFPVEFALLGGYQPGPWSVEDVLAFSRVMIWQLSNSWHGELVRARLIEAVGREHAAELEFEDPPGNPVTLSGGVEFNIFGPENTLRGARGPFLNRGLGSNAWVVSGRATTTGLPFLCNDMHLALGVPSIWYEVHLVGGGFDVAGVSLPALPFVMVGHNSRITWGMTLAYTDCEDLFLERFDPKDPGKYLFEDKWQDAAVDEEIIRVKGRAKPQIERVTATCHGPVISELDDCSGRCLTVSSMALKPCRTMNGWFFLNRAADWDDFVRAVRLIESPQLNIVYADVSGNIGYWTSGRVPVRAKGNGLVPSPGWTGEYEWVAEIPFEEMPHCLNPECGYIVTCNNRIVAEDYPHFLGATFLNGFRAKRITECLEEYLGRGKKLSGEDFARIQLDLTSIPARKFVAAVKRIGRVSLDIGIAIDYLSSWDCRLTPESVGAALYEVARNILLGNILKPALEEKLINQLLGEGFHPVLQSTNEYAGHGTDLMLRMLANPASWWLEQAGGLEKVLIRSLEQAVIWLRAELGPDGKGWQWGRIHSLTLGHAMGMKKPLDRVFNLGPFPLGGDTDTPFQAITRPGDSFNHILGAPSHRQIIDLSNFSESIIIHPPGQSGQMGSRHYADLLSLWLEGKYHPMPWSREEIEQAAEGRLILSNSSNNSCLEKGRHSR